MAAQITSEFKNSPAFALLFQRLSLLAAASASHKIPPLGASPDTTAARATWAPFPSLGPPTLNRMNLSEFAAGIIRAKKEHTS
jgi:hypothetical protein